MDKADKEQRMVGARRKKAARIEQLLKSKISPDLIINGERDWWQTVEKEIMAMRKKWGSEVEGFWQDEETVQDFLREMVVTYGKWWGARGRAREYEGKYAETSELGLTQAELQESARLTSELIYFHLVKDFTEVEKLGIHEAILGKVINRVDYLNI